MVPNSKLIFVNRGDISDSNYVGMSYIFMKLIKEFPKEIKQKTILFTGGRKRGKEDFKIIPVNTLYYSIQWLIVVINNVLIKQPSYKIYYFKERLYDLLLSCRIKKPVILISMMYLLKSTKKNKKIGGLNIMINGNPDDFEINQLLLAEQKKHNIYFEDAYTYLPRVNFFKKSLNTYDRIIVLNDLQLQSFLNRLSEHKIFCINSDISPNNERFQIIKNIEKPSVLTFCFLSHPLWLKGLPYLLEAWGKIDSHDALLKIGGRIDEYVQKIIDEKYKHLSNVEYHGHINDTNTFFRSSHVCIVPSLLDASPRVVTEAMFCGLPVIVTNKCGNSILVKDSINGFVIPSMDSDAIAFRIKWFQTNRDKIEMMGVNAKKSIDSLSKTDFKKVSNDFLNLINTALKENENNAIR